MYSYMQLPNQETRVRKRAIGRHAVLWLVVAVGIFLASLYAVRFVAIHRLQQEVASLSIAEQTALDEQSTLRAHLAQKDDPQAIEDVAREKLGLVKPGEQLIIFVKGD